jgi:molybdate transport system substrate-binding protein
MRRFNRAMRIAFALMLVAGCFVHSERSFAQQSWDCAEIPHQGPTLEATPSSVAPTISQIPFPDNTGEVLVFAASSLTDVFSALETDIEGANPGVDLVFNFGGSQTLVTQLADGAPADVFASANVAQMENAEAAGVISGESSIFARNTLVIVVPADNPADIESIADLNNDGVSLVIASPTVPVGEYSRTALCAFDAAQADGAGFLDGVASNIVSNEANVRDVLAKIALGEADAGIVYGTDVTGDVSSDVISVEIPEEFNVIASYPVAAVDGGDTAAADAFISYLLSEEGQAVLADYGFS